ncbi:MAG: ABC transporter permease subunit [Candidatus Aminicenantes bacterium]|nr:ABC transporter permease subunit [Candidatus Aminicenantes bacterium]
MIRALFIKEIREALASRRFWVILALCLVLIPLGVEVSLKGYRTRLQNYREAVRIYQDETRKVSDILFKDGAKAFAPPSPLSFLSLGLELVTPNAAETQYKYGEPPAVMRLSNNQGRDNLYESFYGPLDLVFVVAVVMSFLAIVLTYGTVAGEKEQGTLRQILANSVPRATVILAKGTANFLVLIIPFLLALAASLVLLEVQGNPVAAVPGAWTSIGLAVLIAVLFIGAFFNLGLLVSALTKQAVPALVTLLLLWVSLYGVYPRLSSAVAQIAAPVKSEARVALEKAQVRRNIQKEQDAEIDRLLQTLPDPDDDTSAAAKQGAKTQEEIKNRYQARLEENWQALERDVEAHRGRRNALTVTIARLSPVTSFVRPLAELGRTGRLEYERFQAGVRRFEEVLNRDIFTKYTMTNYKHGTQVNNKVDVEAAAPVFTFDPAPAAAIVRDVLPDVVLLVLFNFVFFAGAFVAFLRYDPR